MHTFKEEPEVLGVNPGCDTMPQVGDPRLRVPAAFEPLAHPLDLPPNRILPTIQYVGIQVALEHDSWTDGFPSNGRVDAPVQPDHVVLGGPSDTFQGGVRSLGEEDERDNGEPLGLQSLTNVGGDVLEVG